MLTALHLTCGSAHTRDCAQLETELAACSLRFSQKREGAIPDAIEAGDMHGGYWHAVVFAPTRAGWRVLRFDGGDVY